MALTYDELRDAVAGKAVGLRARTELEPLGGPGDKVFPPTYGVSDREETKYATEQRKVDGQALPAVVLDSVASQANRFELALLDALRRAEVQLPLVSVDFRDTAVADLDRLSALEAPHRIFDALLRDSLHEGFLFRLSGLGRAITEATFRSAAPLLRYSPTTLVFGGWDSTGPRGGLGSKYERCVTSEIVAVGIDRGVATGSRIDPAGIQRDAAKLYEAPDGTWTLNEDEAVQEKGHAKLVSRSGEGQAGRPSQVNHGNIAPSIDRRAGGVTADRIWATTVISFAGLRRLRFPVNAEGVPIPDDRRGEVESTAHTALASLAIAAVVLAFDEGFDLRSRCVLVPTAELELELLGRAGERRSVGVSRADALSLLAQAAEALSAAGLGWETEEVLLQPTPRLVELIRLSRDLAARSTPES